MTLAGPTPSTPSTMLYYSLVLILHLCQHPMMRGIFVQGGLNALSTLSALGLQRPHTVTEVNIFNFTPIVQKGREEGLSWLRSCQSRRVEGTRVRGYSCLPIGHLRCNDHRATQCMHRNDNEMHQRPQR